MFVSFYFFFSGLAKFRQTSPGILRYKICWVRSIVDKCLSKIWHKIFRVYVVISLKTVPFCKELSFGKQYGNFRLQIRSLHSKVVLK